MRSSYPKTKTKHPKIQKSPKKPKKSKRKVQKKSPKKSPKKRKIREFENGRAEERVCWCMGVLGGTTSETWDMRGAGMCWPPAGCGVEGDGRSDGAVWAGVMRVCLGGWRMERQQV